MENSVEKVEKKRDTKVPRTVRFDTETDAEILDMMEDGGEFAGQTYTAVVCALVSRALGEEKPKKPETALMERMDDLEAEISAFRADCTTAFQTWSTAVDTVMRETTRELATKEDVAQTVKADQFAAGIGTIEAAVNGMKSPWILYAGAFIAGLVGAFIGGLL